MENLTEEQIEAQTNKFVEDLKETIKQKYPGFIPVGAIVLLRNDKLEKCISIYNDYYIKSKKSLMYFIKLWI